MPAPENCTECGLAGALDATTIDPVRVPATVGANANEAVQLPPTLTKSPQSDEIKTKSPEIDADVSCSPAVPLFVNVTVCGFPWVPTACEPKLIVDGENDTPAAPMPNPDKSILKGLDGALLDMLTAPDLKPIDVGRKTGSMRQVPPAGIIAPIHVVVPPKSTDTVTFEICRLVVPVLVTVIA